jgi:hypothetical protein
MKKREDALKRSEGYSHEWLIAIAMSIALFLSVGAFIYLTVVREPVVIESPGFAAAPLCGALLLYILAETHLLAKIRMSLPVRGQMTVWTAWLALLGIAPILDPERVPQSKMALVGGSVMLIFSIKALLFSKSAR